MEVRQARRRVRRRFGGASQHRHNRRASNVRAQDQVALKAGRLFDAVGHVADEPDDSAQRRPHLRCRRRRTHPPGARVTPGSATVMRHDRRACASTPAAAVPMAQRAANWRTPRSISTRASPPCSTWISAAGSIPSICDAINGIVQGPRMQVVGQSSTMRPITTPTATRRASIRASPRARASAGPGLRAAVRGQIARRRLRKNLHHAGFRRHDHCGSRTAPWSTARH